MPKVYLSTNAKMKAQLARWIYGELKIRRMSQQALADELDISRQALGKKLRTQSFSYEDFINVVRVFQPDAKTLERLTIGD
jgi:predicted XRE-type DNA-binding protein